MKRLFYFLIVLSCTLWSCGKSDSDVDDPTNPDNPDNLTNVTLDISTTDLTFKANGGQKEFTIYCNSDWTITNNSSWCKTDVKKGNGDKTITVTTDPYSETEDQNTNLTIKAGDKTKVLTVTQKHGDAIILTKDKFDVPQEGENITIEVKSNIEYQVSIPSTFQTWIKQAVRSRALGTKNFSFTIAANEDFDKRKGYIVFNGNSLKDTVYVYQAANTKTLILTKDNYNIPSEGKTIEVELKSNINYDIIIPDSVSSWINRIQTKAIRTDKINLQIKANIKYDNRQADIIFKDKDSSLADTLKINQVQKNAIILTQKHYQAKATGEDLTVELNSNIEYDVIIPQDAISWISQIKTKALTTNILKFHIEANSEPDKRTTKILFKAKNSNYSDTLQITQLADRSILLTKQEYNLSSTATSIIVEVITNIDFKTIIPVNAQTWIKFIHKESAQKNSLNFSISANDNYEKRSAKIKIADKMNDNNFIEFTINQAQKDIIIIEQKLYEVSAKGETIEVTIKKNTDYTIKIPDVCKEWIQQVLTRSLSTEHLIFNILSNTLLNEREGNIIIEYNSYSDTIKIVQKAKSDTFYGDVFFHHIEGLEEFKEDGYKKVKGNVTVEGNILTSLKELDGILEEIDGDLKLNCETLISLEGLGALKKIGGNFIVSQFLGNNFNGLENLIEIKKSFKISTLENLFSFQGLNKLNFIGEDFEFSENSIYELISFEGLENLTTINGNFKITSWNAKSLFRGLNSLKHINGDFIISTSSTTLDGLYSLTNIGGNFNINEFAGRNLEGLNNLKTIGKNFEISTNSMNNFSSFEGLEELTIINGSFILQSSSAPSWALQSSSALNSLISFKGLNNLQSIGKDFEIHSIAITSSYASSSSLNSLESFEGLENLSTIYGNFKIISKTSSSNTSNSPSTTSSLESLTSFNGLNSLNLIGGNFEIISEAADEAYRYDSNTSSSLNALQSFKGLESLKTINGCFRISSKASHSPAFSLNSLTSFEGLSNLNTIGGDFEINSIAEYGSSYNYSSSLNALQSFKGLDNLTTINGNFRLESQALFSSVSFISTASLKTLSSFEGLTKLSTISGDFEIISNSMSNASSLDALGSFQGLDNLVTINGNLKISSKTSSSTSLHSLKSFEGLDKLSLIGKDFISNDISLNSNGLVSLKQIEGDLSILLIEATNGFNKLEHINGNANIQGKFETLNGFINLETISKNFTLSSQNIINLDGLSKLRFTTDIIIDKCQKLNNIDGLKNLQNAGNILITECPKLYDFCILKNLLTNFSGTFYTNRCGYDATKHQILNGECTKQPE